MPKLLWNLMISLEKLGWTINNKFKLRQVGNTPQFKLVFYTDSGDEFEVLTFYPTDGEISNISVNFDKEYVFIEFK